MAYTTIDKSTDYFNTVLYTGNGTDDHAITGVGFQANFIWIKARSAAKEHRLQNSVSGITNHLRSNSTTAESSGSVKTADSDGFTLGTSLSWNQNSTTYASWNWLAGGTASSNTDGSITSSVSASTTAGFSICSWTGNSGTIGHGLGVKPDVIIVKSRQTANNWVVMHKGLGNMDTNILVLNTTGASDNGGSGMAEPTSSVFTITSGLAANDNNIGYVFAEKKGYSKFGSYTGNGNADGTFVYTGFKPAFVIVKVASGTTGNWQIQDSKRDGFNENKRILANVNEAEKTSQMWDQLSNGFKIRVTSENANGSGMSYIYMAFAEAPFVTAGTKAAGTAR